MALGKLCVVGLGYVGLPVAAKFAEVGFNVAGIDIVKNKVTLINEGKSPIEGNEPDLAELVAKVVSDGSLRAFTSYESVKDADFVIIVVETPFDNGAHKPIYGALISATKSVGQHIKKGVLVIIESTVAPGTVKNIVQPLLESESGMVAGTDFMLATAPERVMPGKLLHNLVHMDRVVGGIDEASTSKAVELYKHIVKGHLYPVDSTTAEVVKTVENAYRDVQIAFANEIALLCENIGVDVWQVRDLVNRAPSRNMHLPGAGVGGHCLPKDSWLLAFGAKGKYKPKLISLARDINDAMPAHMSDLCEEALQSHNLRLHGSNVTILGVAYLENSDDTRNSPALILKQNLEVLGINTTLHDPHVKSTDTFRVLSDFEEAVENSDCVAIVTAHDEYRKIDLDRLKGLMRTPILVDGRNVLDPDECSHKGFSFRAIGRPIRNARNH